MGQIFGSCLKPNHNEKSEIMLKRQEPSDSDKAIAKLKNARQQIYSKKTALYEGIDKQEIAIKKLLIDNQTNQAKFEVQRKILFQKYIEDIEKKYAIIQKYIIDVENLQMDQKMNEVLADCNKLMRDIQNSTNIEEFQEAIENANQISQNRKEINTLFDQYQCNNQDDIEKDLKKYEEQILKEDLSKINKVNVEQHQQKSMHIKNKQNETKKELDILINQSIFSLFQQIFLINSHLN